MKKITLLIVSMLMVTLLAMAQIKLIVYKTDGSTIELSATEVDSIGFKGNNEQPENPDKPYIPNANGHEYVDLGLPSGTLWATMNVGATSAVDYGYYFCWGETTPRTTTYKISDYKLYEGESFDINDSDISIFIEGIKKYSEKDKKTVLEYEDDAARANWGGDWRMPTLKELEELVMNCIIDKIQKNGKEYYRFTSIKNNQSIILPMSGFYECDLQHGIGVEGLYWSSEIYDDSEWNGYYSYVYSSSMQMGEGTPEEYILGEGDGMPMPRVFAQSVRAVLPSKKVHTITFNANGGRGNMSSVDANYAELFTIPTNRFTHTQQDFVCWNTKADGSGKTYMETDKFSVSSDITLYAQWYETYTLKFDANGGGGYMEDIKVKEKEPFKLPKNEFYSYYDYEFAGWNTKPDGGGTSYTDGQEIFISSNMILYAQWKEIGSDNEEGELPETLPQITVPGDGYVTIAIYVPSNTCNGVILVGTGLGEGGTDDWAPEEKNNPFTELEGEDRWYTITVPYSDDLGVKAIALTPEGEAYWNNQWGMNSFDLYTENVVILQGQGYFELENGGEPKLTELLDGSVVYIGIKEWKSAPCVERNKAGEATFTLTAVAPLPEGSVVGIVGNLSLEQNWNIESPIIMTQNGNTYTATCTVGDACEYKYFYSLDGGVTWSWDYREEIYNNREMPLDLNAVDTVEEWIGIPAEE